MSIPKEISDFMERHGIDADEIWQVRPGAFAIKHKALERAAFQQGIQFDAPTILQIDLKEKIVAMSIVGRHGDTAECSTGEAAPYNNKNGYPVAMAEKRAKDRVILKLLNIHGALYSDAELDEVKENGKPARLAKKDARDIYAKLQREVRETTSRDQLRLWGEANADRIHILPEDWEDILRLQYEEQMADLRNKEAA